MISKVDKNVILITKENNLLKGIDINKYNKQYHNLKVFPLFLYNFFSYQFCFNCVSKNGYNSTLII